MDFDFQGAVERSTGPSAADRPEFYLKAIQDEDKTKAEGRPIHKMVEYVKIEVGGDRFNVVDRPARDEHRQKYALAYKAFKEDKDQDSAAGTLLSATGLIDPSRIEDLKYFKVRTVEQYASVPDGNLGALGMGALNERKKCRDYIELSKGNAPMLKLNAEIEKREAQIELLTKQLAQQAARIDTLMGDKKVSAPLPGVLEENGIVAVPKKRGRPAKVQAEG